MFLWRNKVNIYVDTPSHLEVCILYKCITKAEARGQRLVTKLNVIGLFCSLSLRITTGPMQLSAYEPVSLSFY